MNTKASSSRKGHSQAQTPTKCATRACDQCRLRKTRVGSPAYTSNTLLIADNETDSVVYLDHVRHAF